MPTIPTLPSAFADLSSPIEYDQIRSPRLQVSTDLELRTRATHGGRITPLTTTELRWYPSDVETALRDADLGSISLLARLWRACQTNGTIRGVLSTRSSGLLRLPRSFTGDPDHVAAMRGDITTNRPGEFDLYCPPAELALIESDAIGLGVGFGEFVPIVGRDFPMLVRQPPEFLRYSPSENRWYFRSIAGEILIEPGDGRWFFHAPGGHIAPWQNGVAAAVGNAFIDALHAKEHESNWEAKLAHPARVANFPKGASEQAQEGWFDAVGAWGVNTVFQAPPGYEVTLVESNGRGHESFGNTMDRASREAIIAIAGQSVSTDGGSGFQNNDIHETIREDLIQFSADGLAHTINTQAMAHQAYHVGNKPAERNPAQIGWDTTSPKKRQQIANSHAAVGAGLKSINDQLKNYGSRVQIDEVLKTNGIKVEALSVETTTQAIELGVETRATVTTVNEARNSDGLPPLTLPDGGLDPDGDLTVKAFDAKMTARQQVEGKVEGVEESDGDIVDADAELLEPEPEE